MGNTGLLDATPAGWVEIAYPHHLPLHLRAPGAVPEELLAYGKRHRAVSDLEQKVDLLKRDRKLLLAQGSFSRHGEDRQCPDGFLLPHGG